MFSALMVISCEEFITCQMAISAKISKCTTFCVITSFRKTAIKQTKKRKLVANCIKCDNFKKNARYCFILLDLQALHLNLQTALSSVIWNLISSFHQNFLKIYIFNYGSLWNLHCKYFTKNMWSFNLILSHGYIYLS